MMVPRQYENLTSEGVTRKALRDIKRFVGVDPNLPNNDLGLYNSRRSETVRALVGLWIAGAVAVASAPVAVAAAAAAAAAAAVGSSRAAR